MQVSVEVAEGLYRRMTVGVPKERVEQEFQTRLRSLARKTRINGFRPGKVPVRVVQQRFGPQVREEIINDMVKESMFEAMKQENLRPAGDPVLESVNDQGSGGNLDYTISFEIYPEIHEINLEGVSVERPVTEIADADVDKMIDTLRRQLQTWHTVERAAQEGDRVTVDYTGAIDGKPFEGNSARQQAVIPGSGQHLQDFEAAIIGMTADEEKTFDVQFPADYPNSNFAEKIARFAVKVHLVEEAELPPVDDDFAAEFGIAEGGVAVMRDEIRANLEVERDKEIRNQIKQQLFDNLLAVNPVEAPQRMVESEAQRMAENTTEDFKNRGVNLNKPFEAERFIDRATLRVKIGLLVGEIIQRQNFTPDPQQVRDMLEGVAANYDNPQAFIAWHYEEEGRLSDIEGAVLENRVMEWLLERINIIEKPMSFNDLMQRRRSSGTA